MDVPKSVKATSVGAMSFRVSCWLRDGKVVSEDVGGYFTYLGDEINQLFQVPAGHPSFKQLRSWYELCL